MDERGKSRWSDGDRELPCSSSCAVFGAGSLGPCGSISLLVADNNMNNMNAFSVTEAGSSLGDA